MSRSPDSSRAAGDEIASYRKSWEALYNLVDEGKSWSGNERNCAFLNTGGAGFADISAAAGLDFEDDGRAVALSDWDFDGWLDIWVANRTAPRLRLLHNGGGAGGRFVAFRLRGSSCNRDAIGARLTLSLRDGTRHIKTLHAGDGYLAQSSKWVHFGLGADGEIESLEVRWPGGGVESFGGIAAGRFYHVVQGSAAAELWQPPAQGRIALRESPLETAEAPAASRLWLVGRVPLPAQSYRSWDGASRLIDEFRGRPLLINLWSRTCQPCVTELAEWDAHHDAIAAAGVDILALCVDQDAAPESVSDSPFHSGVATDEVTLAFETVQRALVESRKPLPIPCSILLDSDGLVAAIYKGQLAHGQLVADIGLLDATPEQQRAAAVPFPGSWSTPTLAPLPRQVIGTMMRAGRKEAARDYTLRCLAPESKLAIPRATRASLTLFLGDLYLDEGELDRAVSIYERLFELAAENGDIHRELGKRLVTKQRAPEAIRHLSRAVALDPSHADSRLNLASLQMREGMVGEAAGNFRELVRQLPDSALVRYYLADALRVQNLIAEALVHYRAAHRLQPNSQSTTRLAWILATHKDDSVRDGVEAVELAEGACRAVQFRDPALLSVLAAAYAEAGEFDRAITTAEKGLALARAAAVRQGVLQQLSTNLESYRAGQPIRD